MIDVDQFKYINDNYGHVVGDRVLATIGEVLRDHVRPFDVASRLGGDEFAVLLPETDSAGAVRVAERIFRDLATLTQVPVTLSIGVSSLDGTMPTIERLFDEADMALYQVKRAGRDAIAVRGHDSPEPSWGELTRGAGTGGAPVRGSGPGGSCRRSPDGGRTPQRRTAADSPGVDAEGRVRRHPRL